jgi:hypothetical protein
MIEHKSQPLLTRSRFALRLLRYALGAMVLVLGSLMVGAIGYRLTEHMRWVDAVYSAAMILTSMGPSGELRTDAGKIFATCYALFSGLVLLTASTILVAPVVHRVLHRFHLEIDERKGQSS